MPKDTENIRVPEALLDAFEFGEVLTSEDLNQIVEVLETAVNANKNEIDRVFTSDSKSYIVQTIAGLSLLQGVALGDFVFVLEDDILDTDGITVLRESVPTYYVFEETGVGESDFVQKGEISVFNNTLEVNRLSEIIDDLNVDTQQSDWEEENTGSPSYIQNKPTIIETVSGKSPDSNGNIDLEIEDVSQLQPVLDNLESESRADNNSSTSVYPGYSLGVAGTETILYTEIRMKFLDKTDSSNPITRVRSVKADVTPTNPLVVDEVYSLVYFYEDTNDLITQADIDAGTLRDVAPKVGDPKIKIGFNAGRLSREQRKNFVTFAFCEHFGTQISKVAPVGFNALQQAQNVRDLIDVSIRRSSGSVYSKSATGTPLEFDISNGVIIGEGINMGSVDNSNEITTPADEVAEYTKLYYDQVQGKMILDNNNGIFYTEIPTGEFVDATGSFDQKPGDNVSAYKIIKGALPPFRTFLVYALEDGILGSNGFDDSNLEDSIIDIGRIEFPTLPENIEDLTYEIGILLTENGATDLANTSEVYFAEIAPAVRTGSAAPAVVDDTSVTNTSGKARYATAGNQKEINDIIDDEFTKVNNEFVRVNNEKTELVPEPSGLKFNGLSSYANTPVVQTSTFNANTIYMKMTNLQSSGDQAFIQLNGGFTFGNFVAINGGKLVIVSDGGNFFSDINAVSGEIILAFAFIGGKYEIYQNGVKATGTNSTVTPMNTDAILLGAFGDSPTLDDIGDFTKTDFLEVIVSTETLTDQQALDITSGVEDVETVLVAPEVKYDNLDYDGLTIVNKGSLTGEYDLNATDVGQLTDDIKIKNNLGNEFTITNDTTELKTEIPTGFSIKQYIDDLMTPFELSGISWRTLGVRTISGLTNYNDYRFMSIRIQRTSDSNNAEEHMLPVSTRISTLPLVSYNGSNTTEETAVTSIRFRLVNNNQFEILNNGEDISQITRIIFYK